MYEQSYYYIAYAGLYYKDSDNLMLQVVYGYGGFVSATFEAQDWDIITAVQNGYMSGSSEDFEEIFESRINP
jgi:hypothetical protein